MVIHEEDIYEIYVHLHTNVSQLLPVRFVQPILCSCPKLNVGILKLFRLTETSFYWLVNRQKNFIFKLHYKTKGLQGVMEMEWDFSIEIKSNLCSSRWNSNRYGLWTLDKVETGKHE